MNYTRTRKNLKSTDVVKNVDHFDQIWPKHGYIFVSNILCTVYPQIAINEKYKR